MWASVSLLGVTEHDLRLSNGRHKGGNFCHLAASGETEELSEMLTVTVGLHADGITPKHITYYY